MPVSDRIGLDGADVGAPQKPVDANVDGRPGRRQARVR